MTVSFLRGNVDAEADTYREEVMQRPREGTMERGHLAVVAART